ncbi:MAG: DUF4364 family protein [Clostridia bacterium]|nr:DUF4364 family protein [Clostridia bacterium]
MELYDAFTEGIEPGGLRNRNEIKTLICYLVSHLDTPITKGQLNDIICEEGLANYFELNQALSEVIDNGNISIKKGDDPELYITEIGKQNTQTLEKDLPYTVRETALNAAVRLQTRLRREREHKIEIIRLEKGCDITMSVLDGEDVLMSVTIFVADYEQALAVKEKFLSDPVNVYSNIVALLMA